MMNSDLLQRQRSKDQVCVQSVLSTMLLARLLKVVHTVARSVVQPPASLPIDQPGRRRITRVGGAAFASIQ
jgi:hypothetical protein